MIKVTMDYDNILKHFIYQNGGLYLKNDSLIKYKNNFKETGHVDYSRAVNFSKLNDDDFFAEISSVFVGTDEYFVFEFDNEEEAFYFKMKYF